MMRHRYQKFKCKALVCLVAKEIAEHHRGKVKLDLMLSRLPQTFLEPKQLVKDRALADLTQQLFSQSDRF